MLLCVNLGYGAAVSPSHSPKINGRRAFMFSGSDAAVEITGYLIGEDKGIRFVDILATIGKKRDPIASIRYYELEGEVQEGLKWKYVNDLEQVERVFKEIRKYAESFEGKKNIEILLGITKIVQSDWS